MIRAADEQQARLAHDDGRPLPGDRVYFAVSGSGYSCSPASIIPNYSSGLGTDAEFDFHAVSYANHNKVLRGTLIAAFVPPRRADKTARYLILTEKGELIDLNFERISVGVWDTIHLCKDSA